MLDMGNFVHFLLENMIKSLLDEDKGIRKPDDDTLEELARRTVAEYIAAVLPKKERDSARLMHLCERLRKLSVLLTKNIIEEFEPRMLMLLLRRLFRNTTSPISGSINIFPT